MRPFPFRVLAVCLLVAASACQKSDNTQKLAALEEAYHSGLLTKDEYDAKRAALVGAAKPAAPSPAPEPNASAPPAPPVDSAPKTSAFPRESEPATPPTAAPPARQPEPKAAEPDEPAPAPLPGCEDAEYKSSKEKGPQQRFYPYPAARVHKAAAAALLDMDFIIHKDGKNEIEASKHRQVLHGGERFLLRFQDFKQSGQKGTLVVGETKKNLVGRLGQKSWTTAVLAQTACELRR